MSDQTATRVKVRFAPSPTGFLHIGGARTALYNWLYAKHTGGEFFVRIEDTDTERSEERFTEDILATLRWLGLNWDGELVYQSKRMDRYRDLALDLVRQGHAYFCTCSEAEIEATRQVQMAQGLKPQYGRTCRDKGLSTGVIRAKIPLDGHVEFADLIRGPIRFENRDLDDFVLLRSNGAPTYNFTVVVDDLDMHMTHVIRGDDHINNTPKQIHVYRFLKGALPQFAHLPMILGDDKKKLSKRHGAVSTQDYRHEGYLPEALLNFLVRLGWSHGDQEIFSMEEMTKFFDFDAVQKSGAVFNREKLLWINGEHIRRVDSERLREIILEDQTTGWDARARERLHHKKTAELVAIIQPKIKLIRELAEQLEPLCTPGVCPVDIHSVKWPKDPEIAVTVKSRVRKAVERLLEDWGSEFHGRSLVPSPWAAWNESSSLNDAGISIFDIEGRMRALCEVGGVKLGELAQPMRLCLSGRLVSAGVFELLAVLPWSVVDARLRQLLVLLEQ